MSKGRKPVAYIKPQDPSFLVKLKKEAGYVEGPTVDTKREVRGLDSGSDDEHDSRPTVVVLKSGDLTAEEVEKIEKEEKEKQENAKADLTQRVVFQRPQNSKRAGNSKDEGSSKKPKTEKKPGKTKQLLSFDEDDE